MLCFDFRWVSFVNTDVLSTAFFLNGLFSSSLDLRSEIDSFQMRNISWRAISAIIRHSTFLASYCLLKLSLFLENRLILAYPALAAYFMRTSYLDKSYELDECGFNSSKTFGYLNTLTGRSKNCGGLTWAQWKNNP